MQKKLSLFGLFLSLMFCLLMVQPIKASAATFKCINASDSVDAADRTVGGVTFSYSYTYGQTNRQAYTLTASTRPEGKYIVTGNMLDSFIVTDGETVYVSYGSASSGYTLYKTGSTDTTLTKLAKLGYKGSDCLTLQGMYKNRLYYVVNLDPGTLYYYDLKKEKSVKVATNVTTADQVGQYMILSPYCGDASPYKLRVYDCATRKKVSVISTKAGAVATAKKFVYFVEYSSTKILDYPVNITVKRYNPSNGKIKKVTKKLTVFGIKLLTNEKIVYYTNYSHNTTKTIKF